MDVFKAHALPIRRAISGTALTAAPFARRAFGTVSRRRYLRQARKHENDQQAKKHSRHFPSPFRHKKRGAVSSAPPENHGCRRRHL